MFGPDDTVLTDFTKSQAELTAALGKAPPLAEGTHIYDALIRASELAEESGLQRTTVVLLSDGTDVGSDASRADALAALEDANVRVISVGLRSKQYDPAALKGIAESTGGTYSESASPAALAPLFAQISARLSREYTLRYTSLLPPETKATVRAAVAGFPAATATYTSPSLGLGFRGTFDRSWIDQVILSPFLMVFVIVSVLALLVFAILTAFDVRSRSIRRRMAQYVTVPTEEESNIRRAEVASLLAGRARNRVAGQEWWQSFEKDVELGGFKASATTLVGWSVIAGVLASLVMALVTQSLWGLLVGLAAPFVLRLYVKQRVTREAQVVRRAASRQPRSARGSAARGAQPHRRDERDGRRRGRALEDGVPPRSLGRAARRPDRPGADGHVAADGQHRHRAGRDRHAASGARPAATLPRSSIAWSRTSAAGWRSAA